MELPAYQGSAGGKFRSQPLRRPSPYDRPPSAARGLRGLSTAGGSGSGWLSKIVDPASRFITGSASRIFSSVFRKGLRGLPEAEGPEHNCQVRPHLPVSLDVVQEAVDGHNPTKNFETRGVSEIELLLKQNKYTRAQADYLTGLICSRAIEPPGQESENYSEEVHVSDKGIGVRNSTLESPLNIPQDMDASPAEIAKAYMSSRLPKPSTSVIGLQSQGFREDKSLPFCGLSATKTHGLSDIPRSVLRFSEPHTSAGYPTPRPRGRSAIYRMSRSSYFKVDPAEKLMASKYTTVSNAPASSQEAPASTSKSDGRQALKRRNSVLHGEYGSFGPIRRIRQKSGLMSSTSARLVSSSSSHGFPLLQLEKEDLKDPSSSQQPLSLNQLKYGSSGLHIDKNGSDKIFSSHVPPVLPQSIEASRKILEHLDKFTAPEKKRNMKPLTIDESPSKLTNDMLNGRALRSLEKVDTTKFIGMDVIGTSEFRNANDPQKNRDPQSDRLGKEQENSPSNLPGVKLAMPVRPSICSSVDANTIPVTVVSQKRPAFQMTAPEDSLELDDEQDAVEVSVGSTVNVVKKKFKTAESEAFISSMPVPELPLPFSSKSLSDSSSIPFTEISKASGTSHDSDKESSFRFPVVTESGGLSSPSLTPTIPSQLHEKLLSRSEQTVVPAFMFGSSNSVTAISSSVTDVANADQSRDRKIQLERSNLFSGGKYEAEGLHKSSGLVALPGISVLGNTETMAFGASITSTLSNGSVHSSSLSYLLESSTPDAAPRSTESVVLPNSNLTAANSSSEPISSTLHALPPATIFNFGASSPAAPVSASPVSDKSISVDTEGKVSDKSPVRSLNSPTTLVASQFLTEGNINTSLIGSYPFPGSGSTPSVEAVPSSSMSMATNSTSVTPYIFSGVSSSGSGFSASPSFSTETNLFGFSAIAQTNSTSDSAANSSSQKFSTNFGASGGFVFGVQPAHSGSSNSFFSQSSTSQASSFSSSLSFGLSSSSSPGFGQGPFGTSNASAKTFGSTSGFMFPSATSTSSSSGFPFSYGTGVSTTSSQISPSIPNASNSSPGLSFLTGSSTSNSGFSFSAGASSFSQASNTFPPPTTSGLIGSSSFLGSSSLIPRSQIGSSPATEFSFGLKATGPNVSTFAFGSSSGPGFSSSGTSMSAASTSPVTDMRISGGFNSGSQNTDQMSIEDAMSEDINQAPPVSAATTFSQPSANPYANFVFGVPVPSSGTPLFPFNSQQNTATLQNSNTFQAGGNPAFAQAGAFSLGSMGSGGDKSSRKIVRVKRDKIRRK